MTLGYQLGNILLAPANSIWIMETSGWDVHYQYSSASTWRGAGVKVTDHRADVLKVKLSGIVKTRAALTLLATYDVKNYDWNVDSADIHFSEDETRKWKVYSCSFGYKPRKPRSREHYDWWMELVLTTISAKGYAQIPKTATATASPTAITGFANAGSKDALFDSIKITGVYSGGNLASPAITDSNIPKTMAIADVLLDGAYIQFLEDYQANHVAIDDLSGASRWGHNKDASSGVTYSSAKLIFALSSFLRMRYRLTHPLNQDPVLTLTVTNLVGVPVLEVSSDNSNWYTVGTIVAGAKVEYPLSKLIGASDFYWRITCGAAASFYLSYMKLESWHSYSGQKPALFVTAGAVAQVLALSFSAGHAIYEFLWCDNYLV